MRESAVESAYIKKIKLRGGEAYKFVSPGHIGVPDRLVLMPVPEAMREIVGAYVKFVELKAPGKKCRPTQVREIARLRKLGFVVEVWDGQTCN